MKQQHVAVTASLTYVNILPSPSKDCLIRGVTSGTKHSILEFCRTRLLVPAMENDGAVILCGCPERLADK